MSTTSRKWFHFDRETLATVSELGRRLLLIAAYGTFVVVSGYLAWIGWAQPDNPDLVVPLVAVHVAAVVVLGQVIPTFKAKPSLSQGVALTAVTIALFCIDFFGVEQGIKQAQASIYGEAYATRADHQIKWAEAQADVKSLESQLASRPDALPFNTPDPAMIAAKDRLANELALAEKRRARHAVGKDVDIGWSEDETRAGAAVFSALILLLLYALFGAARTKPGDDNGWSAANGFGGGGLSPEGWRQLNAQADAGRALLNAHIADQAIEDSEPAHVTAGRKGGQKRAQNLTASERSDIARNAAKTRWHGDAHTGTA